MRYVDINEDVSYKNITSPLKKSWRCFLIPKKYRVLDEVHAEGKDTLRKDGQKPGDIWLSLLNGKVKKPLKSLPPAICKDTNDDGIEGEVNNCEKTNARI